MSTIAARTSQPSTPTGPGGPGESRMPRPATPRDGERLAGERPSRRRKAIDPSSAQALAMLTRQPIFAAPVPRVHVGPRAADGSILVDDRISDRKFLVYTPRLESQFRAGYRAGLWYVRTPGDAEPTPKGPGFPDAVAAIETLRSPRNPAPAAESFRARCRVIWS
jgi:hypothetical protein